MIQFTRSLDQPKSDKLELMKFTDALVLAYDIGGTKVSVGVVDQSGKILTSHREPIVFAQGKKAALKQIADLGVALIKQYPKIKAVGVASAGPLDPVLGLLLDPTNFKSPEGPWGIVPIVKILKKALKRPVYLENDAAAAMLAEQWKGAAKNIKNAMVLTLGTGLGTAAICNGKLVRAGRNLHTEGGHMILDAQDASAPCGCGNFGCAEAYLSGRSFTRRSRKQLGNAEIDASQIISRAQRGEKKFVKLFEAYSEKLALLLHSFARIYAPEVVIFTGSFASSFDLFSKKTLKTLGKMLKRNESSKSLIPILKVSRLKNEAGLMGGAYIALRAISPRSKKL